MSVARRKRSAVNQYGGCASVNKSFEKFLKIHPLDEDDVIFL
jgi:hypothetical protein